MIPPPSPSMKIQIVGANYTSIMNYVCCCCILYEPFFPIYETSNISHIYHSTMGVPEVRIIVFPFPGWTLPWVMNATVSTHYCSKHFGVIFNMPFLQRMTFNKILKIHDCEINANQDQNLNPQFYIQLLCRPHLWTWILPFGLLGSKMKISETTEFLFNYATFLGGFLNFLWTKN